MQQSILKHVQEELLFNEKRYENFIQNHVKHQNTHTHTHTHNYRGCDTLAPSERAIQVNKFSHVTHGIPRGIEYNKDEMLPSVRNEKRGYPVRKLINNKNLGNYLCVYLP